MSQIHEYELLAATYPAELSEAVTARLGEGWSLCGSPFASGDEVYQAVVRTTKSDDKRLRRRTADARPAE